MGDQRRPSTGDEDADEKEPTSTKILQQLPDVITSMRKSLNKTSDEKQQHDLLSPPSEGSSSVVTTVEKPLDLSHNRNSPTPLTIRPLGALLIDEKAVNDEDKSEEENDDDDVEINDEPTVKKVKV